MAEYMTDSQLESLNMQDVTVERDSTFRPGRIRKPKQESPEQGVDSVAELQLNLLSV